MPAGAIGTLPILLITGVVVVIITGFVCFFKRR